METPETGGFPPEEQDQEETGADSAEDATKVDEEQLEDREEQEDRGDA
jgi:hypothetical protein